MLADTLPPNVTFGSVASSQGSCVGTSTITCGLGNLANGAMATVTLSVTPTLAGLITNTVSVAGIKPDLDPQNDTATATTVIFRQVFVFLPLITK
jgi:trimeric autotransporter adhesin